MRAPGNLFPMTVRELQLFRALSSLLFDNRCSVPLSSIGVILITTSRLLLGWPGCAGLGWAGHCHNNPCQVHSSDSPILDTNLFLIEESPITFTFSTCLVSLCGGGGQQVGTARVEAAAAHWRLLFDHGGGGGVVRSGGCWRCWLGE